MAHTKIKLLPDNKLDHKSVLYLRNSNKPIQYIIKCNY